MDAMTIAMPERSVEQRMEALGKANRIRSARRVLKADIKGGRTSAREVLRSMPADCWTMKVKDLLLAQPKIGEVKANKMLKACNASPSKTVVGLSPRQRRELIDLLA